MRLALRLGVGLALALLAAFVVFVPVVPGTVTAWTVVPAYHFCGLSNLTPRQLAEATQRLPIIESVSYALTGWMGVAYVPASNLSGSLWVVQFTPGRCG